MNIRFAKAADMPALTALEYQHYEAEGYPSAFLFQAYRQWPRMFWVAQTNREICGYVLAAPGEAKNEAWIMSALIGADYRGQGVGSILLQHALEELVSQGFKSIQLSVAPENTNALKLYEKLGFVIAERKDNYLGIGEHRVIMCFNASFSTCSNNA
ncbi:acetyltransferase [Idiomarina sp. A28L]|uniref:GNAT family N-acetyltransferase n=1 Tax=Idiomarina sp. A28L TaxID=1036674 RepID=UPI00021389E9|nr:N-acetyltransferase [Idiomarina sp. A28L]EGN76243.1 acetyltransferase [Idiomarina sp. A28L]